MERETIKPNQEPKLGIGIAISNICTFRMVAWSCVQVHVSLIIVFECNIFLSVQTISCTEYLAAYFYLGNKSLRWQTLMRRLFSLLFFRKVVGIERFTLKPRFLPIRVDAPRGVLRIWSDGGWSNGAKIKTRKKSPGLPTKPQKIPPWAGYSIPTIFKWKNRGLWTVYLSKMRQRVDRRQPFFLRLSWLGNGSNKEDTKMLNRRAKLKTLMIMPQTLFFCLVQLCHDFLSQWDLVCDRKHLKAMTQSVYMGGLLVGSVAFSTLSDHFGRKVAVFLSILIMVSIERIVFEMWLFELCSVNTWNRCQQTVDAHFVWRQKLVNKA